MSLKLVADILRAFLSARSIPKVNHLSNLRYLLQDVPDYANSAHNRQKSNCTDIVIGGGASPSTAQRDVILFLKNLLGDKDDE